MTLFSTTLGGSSSERLHKSIRQNRQQHWLRDNLLAFIEAENWPSSSLDLNPLDYIQLVGENGRAGVLKMELYVLLVEM